MEKNIKKINLNIYKYLENNKNKKIAEVFSEIVEILQKNKPLSDEIFLRDLQKNIVGIRCAYFLRYMPLIGPAAVHFNKKKTASGYNPMCETGAKLYYAGLHAYKKSMQNLADKVLSGEFSLEEGQKLKKQLEIKKNERQTTDLGFATREELVQYLHNEGVELLNA